MTRQVIDKIQKYYGGAIRANVNENAETKDQLDAAIKKMQNGIKAVLYRSVKFEDPEERHQSQSLWLIKNRKRPYNVV